MRNSAAFYFYLYFTFSFAAKENIGDRPTEKRHIEDGSQRAVTDPTDAVCAVHIQVVAVANNTAKDSKDAPQQPNFEMITHFRRLLYLLDQSIARMASLGLVPMALLMI
jgi:hypothetical protein